MLTAFKSKSTALREWLDTPDILSRRCLVEIPMNPVDSGRGHYNPKPYDGSQYKIIFTYAELRAGQDTQGKEILLNVVRRVPVVEVWIDLSHQQVTDIKDPPETIKYENIPVPVY